MMDPNRLFMHIYLFQHVLLTAPSFARFIRFKSILNVLTVIFMPVSGMHVQK